MLNKELFSASEFLDMDILQLLALSSGDLLPFSVVQGQRKGLTT